MRLSTKILMVVLSLADIFAIVMAVLTGLHSPEAVTPHLIDDKVIAGFITDRYMEVISTEFVYLALALTGLLVFLLFNEFGVLLPFLFRCLGYFVLSLISLTLIGIIISESVTRTQGEYKIAHDTATSYMISTKGSLDTYYVSTKNKVGWSRCDKDLYYKVKDGEYADVVEIIYRGEVIRVLDPDIYKIA